MGGRVQDVVGRPLLHDAARIHHRDPVAELRHDAEVMGDEEDREPPVAAQIVEQRQDLRLHRDVERGGGFVRDDHLGVVGQRHGDADALAHAARHLVRVAVDAVSALGMRTCFSRSMALGAPLRPADAAVAGDRLDQLVADAVERVQRRQRVLEDVGDAAPRMVRSTS
jgi:hypothetical protein